VKVLGVHDGHNASAALLRDGRVAMAVSEERLSRTKNQGGFPARAVDRIMAEAGLAFGDLDRVAFSSSGAIPAQWSIKDQILARYARLCEDGRPRRSLLRRATGRVKRMMWDQGTGAKALRQQPLQERGVPQDRILALNHHALHAASAYYACGALDEPVLVLTNDGGGDGLCATVSLGRDGRLLRLAAVPQADSYANLYARATFLLGMVPLEHEYKLMGLAPYADRDRAEDLADRLLDDYLWSEGEPLAWRRRPELGPSFLGCARLRQHFGRARFDVVAAAMQLFIERLTLDWVRRVVRHTGVGRLVLSGGLFMNVKLNGLIRRLPGVDWVWVMPSCGDESNIFGAAYLGALDAGGDPSDFAPLGDLYLGPRYTEGDLSRAIEPLRGREDVIIDRPDDIERATCDRLVQGDIVVRCRGREEFGARALGNRSILADPARLEVVPIINRMIKHRDFWMPFAGTMTDGQARHNLDGGEDPRSPHMMMTFQPQRPPAEYQAAVHPFDHSIRPQILEESHNPEYYRLLKMFEAATGRRGGLLNTSFNLHGHPIVSSPADAVEVFLNSGLNHLGLGPYLLSKRGGD
jgi:carbamoyltransferase